MTLDMDKVSRAKDLLAKSIEYSAGNYIHPEIKEAHKLLCELDAQIKAIMLMTTSYHQEVDFTIVDEPIKRTESNHSDAD